MVICLPICDVLLHIESWLTTLCPLLYRLVASLSSHTAMLLSLRKAILSDLTDTLKVLPTTWSYFVDVEAQNCSRRGIYNILISLFNVPAYFANFRIWASCTSFWTTDSDTLFRFLQNHSWAVLCGDELIGHSSFNTSLLHVTFHWDKLHLVSRHSVATLHVFVLQTYGAALVPF